jgi:Fe2+ transport system protein B
MFKTAFALTLLVVSASANAQPTEDLAIQRMLAEHQQWTADHQTWHQQHLEMAKKLEAAAAALKSKDLKFARDSKEMEAHGKALMAATTPQARQKLVADHVRTAAEHAAALQAHHEMLDEVVRLEALLEDDRGTQAAEEPN